MKTHRRVQIYRYKLAKIDLNYKLQLTCIRISEAVTWQCSAKKMFLKTSQNLRENTYARVSFSLGLSFVISKVSVAGFEHE